MHVVDFLTAADDRRRGSTSIIIFREAELNLHSMGFKFKETI